jgi:CheY-like chemotaxis protein
MLGGTIGVRSTAGSGSTFTATVDTGPLAGVAMLENEEDIVTGVTVFNPAMASITGRVLLAEDGRDNQLLISRLLEKAGATVAIAANGRIALDTAMAAMRRGKPFDVILMDMQMPELDGYEVTASLRSAGYDRPIVALTAHCMAGDRERCVAAGCDDYLAKPVNRTKLIAVTGRYARRALGQAQREKPAGVSLA